jgi:LysR family transcriptional regulator, transcriptional activator of the cysJI operon
MAGNHEENRVESLYLKTLVEVIRTGSLSRAAETLHVTQPAVSRRVKFMEDQYGCALLDRSGSSVRPTEAGRLVYDKARAVLEIEADLVSGLHRLDGRTRVSLSCTPSFGIAHLPTILREFMLACADTADLKFIFNTPEGIFKGLDDGIFDLAVMELCERFDLSAYATYPLPGDEMVFVSSPGLAVASTDTSLDALFAIPLFARREGCCSRMLLEKNLVCVGHDFQEFRKVIVFDDLHVIVKAVLNGDGIAFLSRDVVEDHLAAGRLVPHRIPGFTHARDRVLVLGAAVPVEGPVHQFVTALFDHFRVPMPNAFSRPATRSTALAAGRPHGDATAPCCGPERLAQAPPTSTVPEKAGKAARTGQRGRVS